MFGCAMKFYSINDFEHETIKLKFLLVFFLKDPVDASDFKLDKFMAGSTESFEPYYGVGGAEGDGDILKMTNIEEFARHVMKYSKPFGGKESFNLIFK